MTSGTLKDAENELVPYGLFYRVSVKNMRTGEMLFDERTVGRHRYTDANAVMRKMDRLIQDVRKEIRAAAPESSALKKLILEIRSRATFNRIDGPPHRRFSVTLSAEDWYALLNEVGIEMIADDAEVRPSDNLTDEQVEAGINAIQRTMKIAKAQLEKSKK